MKRLNWLGHLALIGTLAWAGEAAAWGERGTALVGALAQRQLTPEAAAEAKRLLGMIKQDDFAAVANWAGNLGQNPQTQALWEKTKNERRVIYKGDDCQYQPPEECPDGVCTVAAIERNRAALSDPKAPNQARVMALLFLIHHVADAHSPLNNSFKDDKGGYDYKVTAGGKTYNLRQVWDDFLLSAAQLDTQAYADKLQKGLPAAGDMSPVAWSEESCRIVRDDDIYPRAVAARKMPRKPFDDDDDGGIDYAAKELEYNRSGYTYSRGDKLMNQDSGDRNSINAAYMSHFVPLAEQRVQLASVRLATLLDEALVAGRPAQ